ncbi:MAG: 4-hydroxythreonine-4-phosphate dehydrogenase PdxA [Anaerolineae bacterium]|nr:4-hydroxythreonine-4-phosphate dehydrogenase PdxA [Anaerolineae bacterium]
MNKPTIAIAMGDPAGIGPELIVKVLSEQNVYEHCRPFIVGAPKVMNEINEVIGAKLRFKSIQDLAQARFSPSQIDVLCPNELHIGQVQWGKLDPTMGKTAAVCLETAFELAMAGRVQGVISAPLNKEAFHLAGYPHLDDLTFAADITRSPNAFIMGMMGSLWTASVAEHVAFKDILSYVKQDRILQTIRNLHDTLVQIGRPKPRIAVAALNVHAGEGGLFGAEEIDEIAPAIQAAQAEHIDAFGPVPADMIFVRALAEKLDGVVCMHHDQANIARKLQPKSEGATFFMGLPVPCGTTAHGTAFDIAGRGIADPGSMSAALTYTAKLASSGEVK